MIERTHENCIHEGCDTNEYPCTLYTQNESVAVGAENCPAWAPKPEKKESPKPKGIDIVMVCGETHHIDTEQPNIQTVKVNGEQVYPTKATSFKEPKSEKEIEQMLNFLLGGKWKFRTNQTQENLQDDLKWYHDTNCDFTVPKDPWDRVVVKHTWMRGGAKRDYGVGVYCRIDVETINPKKIHLLYDK